MIQIKKFTESNRFEVRKTDGVRFKNPAGYATITGYGMYDTGVGSFIANRGDSVAVSYRRKSIAQDIVDQWNTLGPSDTLYYAEEV